MAHASLLIHSSLGCSVGKQENYFFRLVIFIEIFSIGVSNMEIAILSNFDGLESSEPFVFMNSRIIGNVTDHSEASVYFGFTELL